MSFISQLKSLAALDSIDVVECEDSSAVPTYSQDHIKTLSLVYGYIPCSNTNDICLKKFNWNTKLLRICL